MGNILFKVFLFGFFFLGGISQTQEFGNKKKFHVGIYDNPPQIFLDASGKPAGVYFDILEQVASAENWEFEYHYDLWKNHVLALEQEKMDLLVAISFTPDRAERFTFTQEDILLNWGQIYQRKEDPYKINNFLDLRGKKIGGLEGGAWLRESLGIERILDNFDIKATLIDFDSHSKLFQALEEGSIDVVSASYIAGIAFEQKFAIARTPIIFNASPLRIAFPKKGKNTPLLQKTIDFDVAKMKEEGFPALNHLLDKYVPVKTQSPWWLWGLLSLFGIVALCLFGNRYVMKERLEKEMMRLSQQEEKLFSTEKELEKVKTEREHFFQDMIAIVNFEEEFLSLNSQVWEQRCGYSIQELKTKPFLAWIEPEDRKKVSHLFEKIQEGLATWTDFEERHPEYPEKTSHLFKKIQENILTWSEFEARLLCKDGQYKWFLWSLTISYSEKLYYFVAHEITRQKEIVFGLKSLLTQAEETNKIRSALFADINHELRTPLNSVLGFSNILLKNKEGHFSEKDLQFLSRIKKNGEILLELINSLLDYFKIEAQKSILNIEDIDIINLIKECVEIVQPLLLEKNLKMQEEYFSSSCIMSGDTKKIRQCILNLFSNAIKFTQEGGHITIQVFPREENLLQIVIQDTGIGMTSEETEKIFDPFVQAKGALQSKTAGTGLGLSITKSFVEQHHGRITVKSQIGVGTSFNILFPTNISLV